MTDEDLSTKVDMADHEREVLIAIDFPLSISCAIAVSLSKKRFLPIFVEGRVEKRAGGSRWTMGRRRGGTGRGHFRDSPFPTSDCDSLKTHTLLHLVLYSITASIL
ncbi:hypothetical protein NPIL_149211 [Nephila pilipes]|uniref:Uncharacterized protein n=1 Tax=Nephila pilipes TaxID=299642 RepID=A0A8X6THD6_NEPPI|nr:hypothetical protein NPIL_149211 [Nephila pilipes]